MKKIGPIILFSIFIACDSAKVFEQNTAFENIFGV